MGSELSLEPSAVQASVLLREIFSSVRHGFKIRLWDQNEVPLGQEVGPVTVVIPSVRAFKRLLMNPTSAAFAQAYCDGDIDLLGNLFDVMKVADSIDELDISYWQKLKIGLRVKRIPE